MKNETNCKIGTIIYACVCNTIVRIHQYICLMGGSLSIRIAGFSVKKMTNKNDTTTWNMATLKQSYLIRDSSSNKSIYHFPCTLYRGMRVQANSGGMSRHLDCGGLKFLVETGLAM